MLALAFLLEALIPTFIPCVEWFPCLPTMPFEYMGVSTVALVLGLTLWKPLNWIWKLDEESRRVIDEEGDPFEQLINRALDSAKPVMLTLKGGKVYVGFVVSSFAPAREQRTIHIVPIKSGYREATKQRVNFTTDYSEALEKITSDLARLEEEKLEAEKELQRLKEVYKSLEQKGSGLDEEREKNKAAVPKATGLGVAYFDDGTADFNLGQQAHMERVINSQQEAIDALATSIDDFGIVIPIAEVTSATLYSADIHAEYFAHTDPE